MVTVLTIVAAIIGTIILLALCLLVDFWPVALGALGLYIVYRIVMRVLCFREYIKYNNHD